jgi:hypothetical protein
MWADVVALFQPFINDHLSLKVVMNHSAQFLIAGSNLNWLSAEIFARKD